MRAPRFVNGLLELGPATRTTQPRALKTNTIPAGLAVGTLRSPDVDCFPMAEGLLAQLLAALGWSANDLDPGLPPAVGFGGNRHPVLVAGDLDRLATPSYDFDALQRLCRAHDWVTVRIEVELLDRAALISGHATPIEHDDRGSGTTPADLGAGSATRRCPGAAAL